MAVWRFCLNSSFCELLIDSVHFANGIFIGPCCVRMPCFKRRYFCGFLFLQGKKTNSLSQPPYSISDCLKYFVLTLERGKTKRIFLNSCIHRE